MQRFSVVGTSSWNSGIAVQILMIEVLQHLLAHCAIDHAQVADHPGLLRHLPADRHFEGVVVTVAKRVVALSIDRAVLFFTELVGSASDARRQTNSGG